MKNCIYCKEGIDSDSVVDICKKCMYQVWGEKMSETIISSMEREKKKGNMDLWNNENKSQEDEKKKFSDENTVIKENQINDKNMIIEEVKIDERDVFS